MLKVPKQKRIGGLRRHGTLSPANPLTSNGNIVIRITGASAKTGYRLGLSTTAAVAFESTFRIHGVDEAISSYRARLRMPGSRDLQSRYIGSTGRRVIDVLLRTERKGQRLYCDDSAWNGAFRGLKSHATSVHRSAMRLPFHLFSIFISIHPRIGSAQRSDGARWRLTRRPHPVVALVRGTE